MRKELLKGQRYGRLTVVKRVDFSEYKGKQKTPSIVYLFKCDCGNEKVIQKKSVLKGLTTTCGCKIGIKHSGITHGSTKTRLYNIYCGMKRRCYNKNEKAYPRYGGRGIVICNEWLGKLGFINFKKWALENGYSDNLSIERIDNEKGYNSYNCSWIPKKDQSKNRRNVNYVFYWSKRATITEFCEDYKLNIKTINNIKTRLRLHYQDIVEIIEVLTVEDVREYLKSRNLTKYIKICKRQLEGY